MVNSQCMGHRCVSSLGPLKSSPRFNPTAYILFIGTLRLIPFKVCAAQNLGTWRCTSAPPLGMQMFLCVRLSLSVFLPRQLAWHRSATPFTSWIRVNRIAQVPIATSCFKYCVYSRFQASFEDLGGTPPSSQASRHVKATRLIKLHQDLETSQGLGTAQPP
jgi:hypothetical protein